MIKCDKEKVNKLIPEVIVISPGTKIHDILNNFSNLLNLKKSWVRHEFQQSCRDPFNS